MTNLYDDGNIPDTDRAAGKDLFSEDSVEITKPLLESSSPRKDGPRGD